MNPRHIVASRFFIQAIGTVAWWVLLVAYPPSIKWFQPSDWPAESLLSFWLAEKAISPSGSENAMRATGRRSIFGCPATNRITLQICHNVRMMNHNQTPHSESAMRIVSLLPSATEIVCSLGLRDQLVGVTHECDFPDGVQSLPPVTRTLIPHDATSSEIDTLVREHLKTEKALYSRKWKRCGDSSRT